MSMSGTKENSRGLILVGLLDRPGFVSNNRVYSSLGVSPAFMSAIGLGGGVTPKILIIKKKRMKIATPKTADNLSPTITTRQNNISACNLVSVGHYPMGGG